MVGRNPYIVILFLHTDDNKPFESIKVYNYFFLFGIPCVTLSTGARRTFELYTCLKLQLGGESTILGFTIGHHRI